MLFLVKSIQKRFDCAGGIFRRVCLAVRYSVNHKETESCAHHHTGELFQRVFICYFTVFNRFTRRLFIYFKYVQRVEKIGRYRIFYKRIYVFLCVTFRSSSSLCRAKMSILYQFCTTYLYIILQQSTILKT